MANDGMLTANREQDQEVNEVLDIAMLCVIGVAVRYGETYPLKLERCAKIDQGSCVSVSSLSV